MLVMTYVPVMPGSAQRMKQIHFVPDEDWNEIVSERNAIAGGTRQEMGKSQSQGISFADISNGSDNREMRPGGP